MAKLFVVAGHGAGDPGACGNGYTEAERVRALAQRIKDFGGGDVMLGDFNRNYYADGGISSLNISKDYKILELHMDSASASAKGGHVIIKSGFDPDEYDNALANLIGGILPGRSKLIVGRSDLANPNRAAVKGYNYRLLECGFISNVEDVAIFNGKMDEIAKGILAAFGIGAGVYVPPSAPSTPVVQPSTPSSSDTKPTINFKYRVRTNEDGWLPEVVNLADYAGIPGHAITDIAIGVDQGSLWYQVHVKGGGWLPKVTGYNTNDYNNGYAGNGQVIDAVRVYYNTPADYAAKYGYQKAQYRVSPLNGNYWPWQYDNEIGGGQDGYAGVIGKAIDRFQLF